MCPSCVHVRVHTHPKQVYSSLFLTQRLDSSVEDPQDRTTSSLVWPMGIHRFASPQPAGLFPKAIRAVWSATLIATRCQQREASTYVCSRKGSVIVRPDPVHLSWPHFCHLKFPSGDAKKGPTTRTLSIYVYFNESAKGGLQGSLLLLKLTD